MISQVIRFVGLKFGWGKSGELHSYFGRKARFEFTTEYFGEDQVRACV